MDHDTYAERVAEIAENGKGEWPSWPLANECIISLKMVGSEQTAYFALEYVDGPAERFWPKDVLAGTRRDWSEQAGFEGDVRPLAVNILAADIEAHWNGEGGE